MINGRSFGPTRGFRINFVLIKVRLCSLFFLSSITPSLLFDSSFLSSYSPLSSPRYFFFSFSFDSFSATALASTLFIVHYPCKLDCTDCFFSKTNAERPRQRRLIIPPLGRVVYLVPGLIMTNITSSSAF